MSETKLRVLAATTLTLLALAFPAGAVEIDHELTPGRARPLVEAASLEIELPAVEVVSESPTLDILASTAEGTGLEIVETSYGLLNCPVDGDHDFISSWGFARDGGKRRHRGNDMFAERGTPVVAMGDGVVTHLQPRDRRGSLGGIWLKITLDSGLRLYYAHLDSIAEGVTKGSKVRIGDVVGYVGDTGNAKGTPPHLHIEIKFPGRGTADPYPLLSQICEGAR